MMNRKDIDPADLTLHLAYAEASMMLLECLMRIMVERNLVPLEEIIDSLETSIETKRLLAAEGSHAEISTVAAGVLSTLANSIAAGSSRGGELA
jgi:hypothetical protein